MKLLDKNIAPANKFGHAPINVQVVKPAQKGFTTESCKDWSWSIVGQEPNRFNVLQDVGNMFADPAQVEGGVYFMSGQGDPCFFRVENGQVVHYDKAQVASLFLPAPTSPKVNLPEKVDIDLVALYSDRVSQIENDPRMVAARARIAADYEQGIWSFEEESATEQSIKAQIFADIDAQYGGQLTSQKFARAKESAARWRQENQDHYL